MPIFEESMANALTECKEFQTLLGGNSPTGASSGNQGKALLLFKC
jgi:hypothetical protein